MSIAQARRNTRLRRGLVRPRRVPSNDKRDPMLRLLMDGQSKPESDGRVMVAVNYHEQWRTLTKAQRLGYLDDHQYLTAKGRALIQAAKDEV